MMISAVKTINYPCEGVSEDEWCVRSGGPCRSFCGVCSNDSTKRKNMLDIGKNLPYIRHGKYKGPPVEG